MNNPPIIPFILITGAVLFVIACIAIGIAELEEWWQKKYGEPETEKPTFNGYRCQYCGSELHSNVCQHCGATHIKGR